MGTEAVRRNRKAAEREAGIPIIDQGQFNRKAIARHLTNLITTSDEIYQGQAYTLQWFRYHSLPLFDELVDMYRRTNLRQQFNQREGDAESGKRSKVDAFPCLVFKSHLLLQDALPSRVCIGNDAL